MQLQTLIEFLEQIFPLELAEDWDNVGLLLGDRNSEIKSVLTCLTVDQSVVDEAIKFGVDCIVSHHPFSVPRREKMDRRHDRRRASAPSGRRENRRL